MLLLKYWSWNNQREAADVRAAPMSAPPKEVVRARQVGLRGSASGRRGCWNSRGDDAKSVWLSPPGPCSTVLNC